MQTGEAAMEEESGIPNQPQDMETRQSQERESRSPSYSPSLASSVASPKHSPSHSPHRRSSSPRSRSWSPEHGGHKDAVGNGAWRDRSASPRGHAQDVDMDAGTRQAARHRRHSRQGNGDGDDACGVEVRGLPKLVYERHLRQIFGAYGQIQDVVVPTFARSGEGRGWAYVLFGASRAARDAIEHMDGGQIDGAIVSVRRQHLSSAELARFARQRQGEAFGNDSYGDKRRRVPQDYSSDRRNYGTSGHGYREKGRYTERRYNDYEDRYSRRASSPFDNLQSPHQRHREEYNDQIGAAVHPSRRQQMERDAWDRNRRENRKRSLSYSRSRSPESYR